MGTRLSQSPATAHSTNPSASETSGSDPHSERALTERLQAVETELSETRKQLFEALARLKFLEQSNPYTAFLDNLTEAVIFINANGEVAFANPRFLELVGVESLDALIFKALPDALWQSPREKDQLFEDLHAGRYVREREFVWRNLREEVLVVLCNATPVRDNAGEYVGAAIALRDITARRAMEFALRRQNEAYLKLVDNLQASLSQLRETQGQLIAETNLAFASSLSAGLVHELSDAVSVIEVRTYVLEHLPQSDEAVLSSAQQIHDAAERIAAVADSLRNLPRHREQPDEFDLRDVVDEVLLELKICQYLDGCDVTLSRPDLPVPTAGRRMQVQQAVRNVVVNAREALARLPEESLRRIDVRLSANGAYAWIDVADTGPGFDRQVLERLFRPGNTTKRICGHCWGLGLGLFVAHEVARAHGGAINVENLPDAGARVRLSFPLASLHPAS